MSTTIDKKIIFIIGGTGAQGLAVIDALLAPAADGSPSPYAVRALTRDTEGRRAKELAAKGVELVKGAVDDLPTVLKALQGAWGAFVNTDSFTIGEQKEVFLGMRIFELAKQAKTVRHYVWSSLDYVGKKTGYNPKYRAEHYDAKGRVADFLKAQPSVVSDSELSWNCVTTGPYMDMLKFPLLGPLAKRADGTHVFASPTGSGHVPLVALEDIGFFARYSFDHRAEVSGKDLEIASDFGTIDDIVHVFKLVTGERAVAVHLSPEEWFRYWKNTEYPIASERALGDGSTTWRENFTAFWNLYRDDVITRDMEWIRRVNPNGMTLDKWMKVNKYTGEMDYRLLKNSEDGKSAYPDFELIAAELAKA
ncbi:NmrA/HSCARG family protein [Phanerochaete sordida]|uniref:NmrA/HSCARG family protein n=1 Tax=Phanerochaete sordida TaxID=48140 RepID=A0A9P3LCE0_9APHY|nr:NmrA/HSCARG family protein [Phanerochaete sordida]